jgi:transposase
MLLSEGQMSDYKGAALMLPALPTAAALLADKGYDANWLRAALAQRGLAACIPSKSNRRIAIPHDAVLFKQRHKIEFFRLMSAESAPTIIVACFMVRVQKIRPGTESVPMVSRLTPAETAMIPPSGRQC